MNKRLLSESGFSLVQGIILAAVLAGSALVATKLLSEQKLAQKSMETRDQIEALHDILYATLQNRENCEKTFLENFTAPIITTLTSGASPDPLTTIQTPVGDVIARVFDGTLNTTDAGRNTYLDGNVLITGMNLTYQPLPQSTATLNIVYERLVADSNKRTKVGFGGKNITKTITIRVQRDPFDLPTKPFVSCYAVTNDSTAAGSSETGNDINEKFCKDMNGGLTGDGTATGVNVFLWDPTTNTCIPNAKCPDHLIYTGFTDTGTVICKSIFDLINERPVIWSNIYSGTNGTCGPNKWLKFVPTSDGKRVSIECTATPLP